MHANRKNIYSLKNNINNNMDKNNLGDQIYKKK